MQEDTKTKQLIDLDVSKPVWSQFYTVAPLVVIGTKEGGGYDLAPKHMAMPLGADNYFGFVCTPRHATYHNVKKEQCFTVSFIRPDNVVMGSLAALPRCGASHALKPIVEGLPTRKAKNMDALFLKNAYLFLECELHQIIDGFGENSLIAGKIIAAEVDEDSYRASDRDEQRMIFDAPLLAYLPYGRFAEIKNSYAFPYPKGFKQKNLKDT